VPGALWRVKPAGVEGLEGNTPSGVEHRAHQKNSDEHVQGTSVWLFAKSQQKKIDIFLALSFFTRTVSKNKKGSASFFSKPEKSWWKFNEICSRTTLIYLF